MCTICGCGVTDSPFAPDRVIDPALCGVGSANLSGAFGEYVLGAGGLVRGGAVALPAIGSAHADVALAGTDGRVAVAGSPGGGPAGAPGAGFEPETQPAWGFGFAPAMAPAGESVERALTLLPADAVGYGVRQQDAVRRDLAGALSNYTAYAPDPYAGACPLTGAFVQGFRGYAEESGPSGPRRNDLFGAVGGPRRVDR